MPCNCASPYKIHNPLRYKYKMMIRREKLWVMLSPQEREKHWPACWLILTSLAPSPTVPFFSRTRLIRCQTADDSPSPWGVRAGVRASVRGNHMSQSLRLGGSNANSEKLRARAIEI